MSKYCKLAVNVREVDKAVKVVDHRVKHNTIGLSKQNETKEEHPSNGGRCGSMNE